MAGFDADPDEARGALAREELARGALARGALSRGALALGALARGALARGALMRGALSRGALARGTFIRGSLFLGALTRGALLDRSIPSYRGELLRGAGADRDALRSGLGDIGDGSARPVLGRAFQLPLLLLLPLPDDVWRRATLPPRTRSAEMSSPDG